MPRYGPWQLVRLPLFAAALAAAAVGCFLRVLSGTAFLDGSDLITTVESESILTTCVSDTLSEARSIACTYFFVDARGVPGDVTSSATLISEFGILGVLVDPLILQVPTPVSDIEATFDDGSGPQPLLVTETTSFDVDSTRSVSAEPGRTFLIFELPPAVARSIPAGPPESGAGFGFSVSFTVPDVLPHIVKPMLSLRVDVADRTFFLPQIPCVTDFADVPAVELPVPMTDLDLTPIVVAAFSGVSACQGESFEFFGTSLDHDHYRLWSAKSDTKPLGTLAVTDALGTRDLDLKKTSLLGAPANRDGLDPTAPFSPDHLVAYRVKASSGQAKEAKVKGVQVANLYGVQTVDLKKADVLLLPAAKDLAAPVPPLAAPGVNAFLCWRTRYSRGGERLPKGFQPLVVDQLGGGSLVLKKPTRLCLPADVDGAMPGAENDVAALLCFKARAAKPRPPGREGVHTADAVGPQILAVRKPIELCLPSTVQLP